MYDDTGSPWAEGNTDTRTSGATRSPVEKRERTAAIAALTRGRQVVYAAHIGPVIKIGCTGNLALRLATLKSYNSAHAVDLLGFTFGDFPDEAEIHKQLRDHVARGREYYHPTAEVVSVVNGMREGYGLPPLTA